MKNISAALAASVALFASTGVAQLIHSFDDVQYWVGDGANRSVLAIQWNDGKEPRSLAWGFRWDGEVTGLDMLRAVAGHSVVEPAYGGQEIESSSGADERLSLTLWRWGFGDSLYSSSFGAGASERKQADWDSGYWQYWIYGGNIEYTPGGQTEALTYNVAGSPNYSSVVWWNSQVGASERLLVNNSWDALVFLPGFFAQTVEQPTAVAVPEPSTWALLGVTALAFGIWRIRRATRCV